MAFDFSTLSTLVLATFSGIEFPPQAKLTNNTYFDYIIIGGGTAGCVMARRLAEQNCTVLVLEAGGLPNGFSLAPLFFPFLPRTSFDNDYRSTSDPYAASAQGNKTKLTSAKILGGSSGINHLVHVRPPQKDFDFWAEITGDDSWKYEYLLHFFKKSEDMKDTEIAEINSAYHGTQGPVGITRLVSESEEVNTFLKAQNEAGNPIVEDINGETSTGYTQPQYTIARDHANKTGGIRQTTSYSYLYDIKDWPNLHVSTKTTVKKIIFENKTAVGVEADYEGKTYIFYVNEEVILSAGTFNSPQLLHLSGVGPKEHLESFGIETIADLPVGDNLRIAPTAVIVTKTKGHLLPINLPGLLPVLDPTKLPFPVIYGAGAKNKSSNVPDYINFNLMLSYGTPFALLACTDVYQYNLDICLDWQKHLLFNDGIMSVLVNLEAESTGTVRLNSTKASDAPLITTGFYAKPKDLDSSVEMVLDFISFVGSPTMVELGAKVVGLDLKECAEFETDSKAFWGCYLLHRTISNLYSSTCSMGSVVDGNLKVIGLNRVRVVDASVIPNLMHAPLNAVVIALAEKIADQIIAENGGCQQEDTA